LAFNANNQISTTGYRYDAAGNVVMDNAHCYTYDGENRLSSVAPLSSPPPPQLPVCGTTTMSYVYDPDGKRVARMSSGAALRSKRSQVQILPGVPTPAQCVECGYRSSHRVTEIPQFDSRSLAHPESIESEA